MGEFWSYDKWEWQGSAVYPNISNLWGHGNKWNTLGSTTVATHWSQLQWGLSESSTHSIPWFKKNNSYCWSYMISHNIYIYTHIILYIVIQMCNHIYIIWYVIYDMSYMICHIWYVIYDMSYMICHIWYVIYDMSYMICHIWYLIIYIYIYV